MRVQYQGLQLLTLGSLSLVQVDAALRPIRAETHRRHPNTYHNYDPPAKRGLLDSILDGIGLGGESQEQGGKDGGAAVTETVMQTVTVGGGAAAGLNASSAAALTETVTVTQAAAEGAAEAVTETVTVTEAAAGAAGASASASAQLSFVTTTVFEQGAAPTVTETPLEKTVTQVSTVTMMQMIECGTTASVAVPPEQATAIASSAASVMVTSTTTADTSAAVVETSSGLAAAGLPDGVVMGMGFVNELGACVCQASCESFPLDQAVVGSAAVPTGLASLPAVVVPPPAESTSAEAVVPPPAESTSVEAVVPPPAEATSAEAVVPPPAEATSAEAEVPPPAEATSETTTAAAVETPPPAATTTEPMAEAPAETTAAEATNSLALPAQGTASPVQNNDGGAAQPPAPPPSPAPAVDITSFVGANEGPTIDLSGQSLDSVLTLGPIN